MKIVKSSLKQISFSCPSAWTGLSDDGKSIEIHFRCGRLEFKVENKVKARGERDEFDVSSYIELPEALAILLKEGVECE